MGKDGTPSGYGADLFQQRYRPSKQTETRVFPRVDLVAGGEAFAALLAVAGERVFDDGVGVLRG